ncbi:hypothetical protein L3Y34_009737 [Caenorhabditis briggsae]|uniref:Peptidase C1A papain C-terminal domain-containing protein n=2 Tax=Caenorhabditis briggsae TaxID=6238 RepID=A0AAE9A4U8_CAEBR|nr:hypothetical protein L3Y34_009737 [Caenorhabditis briggsae]
MKLVLKLILLLLSPNGFSSQNLTGPDLVDHINKIQNSWRAEYSPISELEMKFKVMDLKFSEISPKDEPLVTVQGVYVPISFDARDHWPNCKSIKLIRNQAYCGACWAFGAAEIISDRICIQSGGAHQPIISVEDILSCCGSSCGEGCKGGYPLEGLKFWMNSGVVTGGDYNGTGCQPYTFPPCSSCEASKSTPSCQKKCQTGYLEATYKNDKRFGKSAYRLSTTTSSNKISTDAIITIQTEIYNNGPVEVSYRVFEDFYQYKSGVYHYVSGKLTGAHAVKIIGWGTENKVDYWLVANSWGTDFGEKGFFKIRRGTNECGIEENVVAGLAKNGGTKFGFFIAFVVLFFSYI